MAPSNIQQIANLLNNYDEPKSLYSFTLKIYTRLNEENEIKKKSRFLSILRKILKKIPTTLMIQSKPLYQKFEKMNTCSKANFFIQSILDLTQTDIDLLSSHLTNHSATIIEYLIVGIKESQDSNQLFQHYISFELDKKPKKQKLQIKKKIYK